MKQLTRRSFTAAGIIAAMSAALSSVSATSCTNPFNEEDNALETVYGPPDDFDPDENETVLYGPPEDFDPDENELVDVYGPPEDFDPIDNTEAVLYGPPDDFDSEENLVPSLYEPPIDE